MKREIETHDSHGEARLRAAAAHLYPGIRPGILIQAATMADIVLSQQLHRGIVFPTIRALDPTHFEFRQAGTAESSSTGSGKELDG